MNKNEYEKKAVNDVYKNAHIALFSISGLMPAVKDSGIKKELKSQYEGYEKFVGNVSSYMAENGIEPKEINPLQKAFMWSGIKMKTLTDKSRNRIAELMIKGTVAGITELTAMKNEKGNFSEETVAFIEDLLTLEESYEKKLKKYL